MSALNCRSAISRACTALAFSALSRLATRFEPLAGDLDQTSTPVQFVPSVLVTSYAARHEGSSDKRLFPSVLELIEEEQVSCEVAVRFVKNSWISYSKHCRVTFRSGRFSGEKAMQS